MEELLLRSLIGKAVNQVWQYPLLNTHTFVYDQIADYIVQLSELNFTGIGAISKDPHRIHGLLPEGT